MKTIYKICFALWTVMAAINFIYFLWAASEFGLILGTICSMIAGKYYKDYKETDA